MHRGKTGTTERGVRGGVVRVALLGFLLAWPLAAQAGEDPGPRLRPPAQPQPQAESREEQQDSAAARRAFERERREDWLQWQGERGGAWREWLRSRREAERALREEQREDRRERGRPRREAEGKTLGRRLEDQWRRQRELGDDRLGDRPGRLENPALERRLDRPGRDPLQPLRR